MDDWDGDKIKLHKEEKKAKALGLIKQESVHTHLKIILL